MAAEKGIEHWPGVIETMLAIWAAKWETKRPDKKEYATKRTTMIKTEGWPDILKQEWIITDCEKQEELEDNYSNKQRQKLTEHALYRKNQQALYGVLSGQLHSDIITMA